MSNFTTEENARRKIMSNRRDNAGGAMKPNSDLTKYADTSATSLVSSTAVFTLLNGISAGNDFYNRMNRAINGKELKIKLAFTQSATAVAWYAADAARVIVLWDHQADSTPVAADVLLDVTAGGATSTTNFSHKNISNKERFIYLYDQNFHLPSYSITTVNQINSVNSAHNPNNNDWIQYINIDLDSLITRFNGTGGTISAINNGALYLFVLGSVAPGSSGWSISSQARYSFFDV